MREALGVGAIIVGMAAALPSIWQTVTHITDPSYATPETRGGEGHVQYHMAREALITAGTFAATARVLAAGPRRTRTEWSAMAACVGGFVAAMWSGGPTVGTWAPNRQALTIHIASTSALSAGVALLRPTHD